MKSLTFILLTCLCASAWGVGESSFSDQLAAKGRLRVPIAQARELESKLGQLFIVNVDGFGTTGDLALEPGFVPMLKRLQIGGVIPHYGSTSYERIRRTNLALAGMTDLPLLLCCDIVKLRGAGRTLSFGDGYVGGFLGRYRVLPDDVLETLARLNAFTFAAIGINVALGPTVDTSTGDKRTEDRARIVIAQLRSFGLEPVIKHFPYLPTGANLHRQSPDTRLPLAEAQRRFAIFGALSDDAGIMMTTHLYDSLVDKSIATFSPLWNGILRQQTGFDGLLMSDGLLMLKNYADRSLLSGGPGGPGISGIDETARWAMRAILAGHDMVIVEGSAAQTYHAFEGLLTVACGGSATGAALRTRINDAYDRITAWKKAHLDTLRRTVDVPPAVMQSVIAAVPAEDANLRTFTFDAGTLARLQPALLAAEVER
ncbi:MAG: glycoside hydrolase family 3 N-terminal domain-containing protein [Spirochaetia bacterium]